MDFRALAVDAVVPLDGEIVMLERNHPPEEGTWVLPGGMVEADETAAAACARETAEEIGLDVRPVSLIGLYDDPDRDERGNVSAAYLCLSTDGRAPRPRAEARRVDTFAPTSLPETGFDHARIVADAMDVRRG
jgi:8-oxo-dGTP diphosphatase